MMNKEMSWVPVFDEDKDNYVPGQYQTKDIYQGENSLPMFDTQEECEQWCQNDSPFASPKVDEPKCNFPNCKCDVELIPDGMSIKCSLTKPVQESYENKALKWYMSLEFTEQVELGFKLIKGPTFNLTISHIMDAYEKHENNHVA